MKPTNQMKEPDSKRQKGSTRFLPKVPVMKRTVKKFSLTLRRKAMMVRTKKPDIAVDEKKIEDNDNKGTSVASKQLVTFENTMRLYGGENFSLESCIKRKLSNVGLGTLRASLTNFKEELKERDELCRKKIQDCVFDNVKGLISYSKEIGLTKNQLTEFKANLMTLNNAVTDMTMKRFEFDEKEEDLDESVESKSDYDHIVTERTKDQQSACERYSHMNIKMLCEKGDVEAGLKILFNERNQKMREGLSALHLEENDALEITIGTCREVFKQIVKAIQEVMYFGSISKDESIKDYLRASLAYWIFTEMLTVVKERLKDVAYSSTTETFEEHIKVLDTYTNVSKNLGFPTGFVLANYCDELLLEQKAFFRTSNEENNDEVKDARQHRLDGPHRYLKRSFIENKRKSLTYPKNAQQST